MSDMTMGQPPLPPQPKFYDCRVVIKKTAERARVACVSTEEFGVSRYARDIKNAAYCFHDVIRRAGDLIDEGYDEEQIKSTPSYTGNTNIEVSARDTIEERAGRADSDNLNESNREIRVTEHYLRMDYEGNGKTALYRVTTLGEGAYEIARRDGKEEIVQVDYMPFAA